MFNTKYNAWVASAALLAGCGAPSQGRIQTNLGDAGNQRVAQRFQAYQESRQSGKVAGCHSGGKGERVLITGFGPFQSVKNNISGALAEFLAHPDFWPPITNGETIFSPPRSSEFLFRLPPSGIRAIQREIIFKNKPITLCSLALSVEWDLAAAAIVFETKHFSPDTVLMMGRGGHAFAVSLEAAAVNNASALTGFDTSGNPLGNANTPTENHVLPPSTGAKPEVRLNWNTHSIAAHSKNMLAKVNTALQHQGENAFRFIPQSGPSTGNTYICNNVAYVVQNALNGLPIELANGNVSFAAVPARKKVNVGFFHFPTAARATPPMLWAWGHLILETTLGMAP
jgi:pyrrolidone-carboxylate peptidase